LTASGGRLQKIRERVVSAAAMIAAGICSCGLTFCSAAGQFKVVEYFWRNPSEFIYTRSVIVTRSGADFWSPPLVSQPGQ